MSIIKNNGKRRQKDEVIKALEAMIREDTGRLIVKEGNAMEGLITGNGIARHVQIRGK